MKFLKLIGVLVVLSVLWAISCVASPNSGTANVTVLDLTKNPSVYRGMEVVVVVYVRYKGKGVEMVPTTKVNSDSSTSFSWEIGEVQIYEIFDKKDLSGTSVSAYLTPSHLRAFNFSPILAIPIGSTLPDRVRIRGIWRVRENQKFLDVLGTEPG